MFIHGKLSFQNPVENCFLQYITGWLLVVRNLSEKLFLLQIFIIFMSFMDEKCWFFLKVDARKRSKKE